jgi:hypothetical protein
MEPSHSDETREITAHKLRAHTPAAALNQSLSITANASLGVCLLSGFDMSTHPSISAGSLAYRASTLLVFHTGPFVDGTPNGITDEALLAVIIERLKASQAGSAACAERQQALGKAEEAMFWMHRATLRAVDTLPTKAGS